MKVLTLAEITEMGINLPAGLQARYDSLQMIADLGNEELNAKFESAILSDDDYAKIVEKAATKNAPVSLESRLVDINVDASIENDFYEMLLANIEVDSLIKAHDLKIKFSIDVYKNDEGNVQVDVDHEVKGKSRGTTGTRSKYSIVIDGVAYDENPWNVVKETINRKKGNSSQIVNSNSTYSFIHCLTELPTEFLAGKGYSKGKTDGGYEVLKGLGQEETLVLVSEFLGVECKKVLK